MTLVASVALSVSSPTRARTFIVGIHGTPLCVAAFALVTLFAVTERDAHAEDPLETRATVLDPRRYELAGFPIVGGNSDIGFQFGAAATWTRFYDRAHPYLWNIDLLLSASVKDDTEGFRMVQQSHVLRLDAPELFGGYGRLDARGSFQRTINAGYYGIGNATTAETPPGQPNIGRTYQYLQEEGRDPHHRARPHRVEDRPRARDQPPLRGAAGVRRLQAVAGPLRAERQRQRAARRRLVHDACRDSPPAS